MAPKSNQSVLLDAYKYKLNDLLFKCESIKQKHGIDVYNDFNIYLSDDERIDGTFDEKCCLACKFDYNMNTISQCSKSKKGDLFCGMHKKPADESRLSGTIIPTNIIDSIKNTMKKTSTIKVVEPKKEGKETVIVNTVNKTSLPIPKNFRSIKIAGQIFYIKQKSLEAYDIHMTRVGTYIYDEELDTHNILEST